VWGPGRGKKIFGCQVLCACTILSGSDRAGGLCGQWAQALKGPLGFHRRETGGTIGKRQQEGKRPLGREKLKGFEEAAIQVTRSEVGANSKRRTCGPPPRKSKHDRCTRNNGKYAAEKTWVTEGGDTLAPLFEEIPESRRKKTNGLGRST